MRHAESATPTLFHGAESDVELGAHGHRQAKAAAEWFRQLQPTLVVSSAMRRAVQTAAPIAALCGVAHVIEPLLHERAVGPLSGRPRDEGEPIWQETLAKWRSGETAYAHPGMESFDAIRQRTLPVLQRIVTDYVGGRIVLVSHGVVCKVLLLTLLPGYSAADWLRIGVAKNVAVSELLATTDGWHARQLLQVPAPVQAVDAARAQAVAMTEA
ncbi:MAG: histidine phosphatase family protein [Gemmataceae bacterium]|nr:histidine phosphatase family protein [Gemmata sp.]MDW8197754.1 histidine phosphatase family protein [Gemmataceae bacterium]